MSNINKNIFKLMNELDLTSNEKEFLSKALELEYKHSDKKRPNLDEDYEKFVEECSGNNEN